ncbi:MAG: hypothetical protein K2Q19_08195 [Rhodocyclaceae bacterium]|nr:hypothetical protein [Rhodocyclaceae bacterium]
MKAPGTCRAFLFCAWQRGARHRGNDNFRVQLTTTHLCNTSRVIAMGRVRKRLRCRMFVDRVAPMNTANDFVCRVACGECGIRMIVRSAHLSTEIPRKEGAGLVA